MTNVCNIFRPLLNQNGNFLLFSTYTDDLSQSTVNSSYRVRPSRFVCLNLPDDISDSVRSFLVDGQIDINKLLPTYFQNIFENGLSRMRESEDQRDDLDYSVNLIGCLANLTAYYPSQESEGEFKLNNYIVYDGNIDMESWDKGFAEIVLNITSGSRPYTYSINDNFPAFSTMQEFKDAIGYYSYPNADYDGDYYIAGWTPDDSALLPIITNQYVDVYDNSERIFNSQTFTFDTLFEKEVDYENDKFTFNSILVFYDVLDEYGNTIYTCVPMGMYFTGTVDGTTGKINNPVTIYTSHKTAYGAGSGWSLRICTRFAPTPHGVLKVEEVAVESGVLDTNLSALMSANAELIKTINGFAAKTFTDSQAYRDLLAMFRNNKTNVPYIIEIDGVPYWYVNGRNTGVVAGGVVDEKIA